MPVIDFSQLSALRECVVARRAGGESEKNDKHGFLRLPPLWTAAGKKKVDWRIVSLFPQSLILRWLFLGREDTTILFRFKTSGSVGS